MLKWRWRTSVAGALCPTVPSIATGARATSPSCAWICDRSGRIGDLDARRSHGALCTDADPELREGLPDQVAVGRFRAVRDRGQK